MIKKTFMTSLRENDWMDENTTDGAMEKVNYGYIVIIASM